MTHPINWILIIVGAALVLMEVLLGAVSGFDFLLIGSAIVVGGLLGFAFHSPAVGIAAAGILSLAYVFLGRKRIRARLRRPGLPSNTDALIGRAVRVCERITHDRAGRIKYEGEEWRAVSEGNTPIEDGRMVRVVRIEGVTAFVTPVEAEPTAGGGNS
jgi:membrane protein implicated in regulation of membrane protease activity